MTPRSVPGSRVMVLLAVQLCLVSGLAAQAQPTQPRQTAQPDKAPAQKEAAVPSAQDKRKAFEADAERLVQLSRELKAELERTRSDELSVKVLRDADEIDRLARSTRTRIH